MNAYDWLSELRAGQEKIDRVISSLAQFIVANAPVKQVKKQEKKKNKRKPMTKAQKDEVSRRMKKYWAKRRKQ